MRLPIVAASAIRAHKLIAPGRRVLVALSGGPDSVALLHCLVELARKRDFRFTLCAAHLNHGLRGKRAATDE
jgi:tRNA(Ile)-lysidine synthase